tara:strand:+ start:6456 stop:7202 length:747 start_codon:yes stop_codon:yes gene_type:complete
MARPGNALGVSVLNAPVAGDAVLANGVVTITGLPPIHWRDIVGYTSTAAATGTEQISTADMSAITPVIGQAYKLVLRPNLIKLGVAEIPVGQSETYIAVASTVVADDLSQQFSDAIDNNTQSTIDAANAAGVITLTQKDFSIAGFTVPEAPGGTVIATGTPYVAPSGTQALVQADVPPTTTVNASTFTKYEISVHKRKEFASDGDVTAQKVTAIIYADDQFATYGAFNTALTTIVDGTGTAAEYLALV